MPQESKCLYIMELPPEPHWPKQRPLSVAPYVPQTYPDSRQTLCPMRHPYPDSGPQPSREFGHAYPDFSRGLRPRSGQIYPDFGPAHPVYLQGSYFSVRTRQEESDQCLRTLTAICISLNATFKLMTKVSIVVENNGNRLVPMNGRMLSAINELCEILAWVGSL